MKRNLPIFGVLAVLLVAIAIANPFFLEPDGFLAFVKLAAPLAILAAGQYFVIVSGEFDLSVGSLVTAEVVIAARLIDGDSGATWPVILLLLAFGALIGAVNGLVTTLLRVPSFIVTLGSLLILSGAVFLWTGGSPRGALSEEFRQFGRGTLGPVPWSVLVLAAIVAGVIALMRSDFGRTLMAAGDNPVAAGLSGVRVRRVKTMAFVLSGLSAAVCAILLGGFAGVSAKVGEGLEFQAITAVVLGGVVLGGGRGSAVAAIAGAFTLQALFTLLNLHGISGALEFTVQGIILIVAVALGSVQFPRRAKSASTTA
ncbi:ABC transporter permease [Streptomyces sp. NBC_00513]|uniref:ABC transporter permease n=1 Tax=unclassified Streptomyces TaxID=2593676 RepID=UPI002257AFB6|nr:ABC transporter permease [Streptomyces sp. NBC_00424]MCX5070978.1 ABC transporter permease [Streptomyces sp. NBC_00424]WUD45586.1 ABC transporter permease [Streptomyces sp. NBC_00513]